MRKVKEILSFEERKSKAGHPYIILHVLTDDGTEATYYGDDLLVGDEVEQFYDKRWDKIKVRKSPKKP